MIYSIVEIIWHLNYISICGEGNAVVTYLGVLGTRLYSGIFKEAMNDVDGCLHAWGKLNDLLAAPLEKQNIAEVFSELPRPRGIIVSSLCESTNQRFVVICKGDFPFPFQTSDQIIESEVKSQLQAIDFYCKKCKKSMRISYALTGDDNAPAMNGIIIKCHTHKCTRVVTLKNFTEGQIKERTDALGKCYL